MDTDALDKPLCVEICEGEIVLSTPEGPFGVSLTGRAALETCEALCQAAAAVLED